MSDMTQLRKETVDDLQDLIRVNIDSAKGFEHAADEVRDPSLESFFRDCASQRQRFASELRQHVHMNDEEAEDSGSIKGKVHRWWLDMRGSMQDGKPHAVLEEAKRGEDFIKGRYERVIDDTRNSPINSVLASQYVEVKSIHDRVRDLRDATK
ncbi:MAG: PA2169 family four-helix-bundle protein [Planctomycetota bacterium]